MAAISRREVDGTLSGFWGLIIRKRRWETSSRALAACIRSRSSGMNINISSISSIQPRSSAS